MSDELRPGAVIGFVGLGNMGHPMAARLAAAGYALRLVDARPDTAQAVATATGGRALASIAELGAELAALILMLPDGATVRRVLIDGGVAQRLAPGCVVIDMSSCEPAGTVRLGAELAERGIDMVDAPVSGGVPKARTGELTIMAGGAEGAVARCRALLGAMGSRVLATGRLGSGQAMKSLNNFVSATALMATCEAVVIGRQFGLDPQVIAEVLNTSTGKNNTTEHKLRQFILSGSFASGFSLDLMVKDLGIAAGVAREAGLQPLIVEQCAQMWAAAQAQLGRGRDHTEMARWVEAGMVPDNNAGDTA